MELQLGLALPTMPVNDFDLNCHVSDPKEPASSDLCGRGDDMISGRSNRKRGFFEAFELPPQTLPLLWNDQPNDDDDDRRGVENSSFIAKKDDDGNCIVGWPPIKFRRKKIYSGNRDYNALGNGGTGVIGGGNPNSKYVKVKMEGVGIARKIDLSRHHSYKTLTNTLINMFGKCKCIGILRNKLAFLKEANKMRRALNSPIRIETETGCLQEMYPGEHSFSQWNV